MFSVPVTFAYEFDHTDDFTRPCVLHEFAANGARYMVLTDVLLAQLLQRHGLRKMLAQEMANEGLRFCDSHAPFGPYLDLNCPVQAARGEMLLRLKLVLEIAASFGVKTMTIHTGNETAFPEFPLEEQYDWVKRSLAELLPFAEQLGMVIAIENIWFQINTPDRLLGIKKEFPTDALGFCYDSGHANLMNRGRDFPESSPYRAWGKTPVVWEDRALEKMLPHVVNCHLHDNDGVSDQHRNPGRGTVDWPHIAGLLKQAPRLQCIQSEVLPVRTHDAIREVTAKFRDLGEL